MRKEIEDKIPGWRCGRQAFLSYVVLALAAVTIHGAELTCNATVDGGDHGVRGCECVEASGVSFGTIDSNPGTDYANNQECWWVIVAPNKVIDLSFPSFNTQSDPCCDLVDIYKTDCHPGPACIPDYTLFGNSVSDSSIFTSEMGYMKIVLLTDDSGRRSGFEAQWNTRDLSSTTTSWALTSSTTTATASATSSSTTAIQAKTFAWTSTTTASQTMARTNTLLTTQAQITSSTPPPPRSVTSTSNSASTTSVSSATTSSTAPTSVTTPVVQTSGSGCTIPNYGKCGGVGWTGSTCCQGSNYECVADTRYYSQCLPCSGSCSSSSNPPPPPPPPPPLGTEATSVKAGTVTTSSTPAPSAETPSSTSMATDPSSSTSMSPDGPVTSPLFLSTHSLGLISSTTAATTTSEPGTGLSVTTTPCSSAATFSPNEGSTTNGSLSTTPAPAIEPAEIDHVTVHAEVLWTIPPADFDTVTQGLFIGAMATGAGVSRVDISILGSSASRRSNIKLLAGIKADEPFVVADSLTLESLNSALKAAGLPNATSLVTRVIFPDPEPKFVYVACGMQCMVGRTKTLENCSSSCGDGMQSASEECDDGNTNDFDGCSANCTLEEGLRGGLWVCQSISYTPDTATWSNDTSVDMSSGRSTCKRDVCTLEVGLSVQDATRAAQVVSVVVSGVVAAVTTSVVATSVVSSMVGSSAGAAAGSTGSFAVGQGAAGVTSAGLGPVFSLVDQVFLPTSCHPTPLCWSLDASVSVVERDSHQVQFMTVIGRVGGENASQGGRTFSQGMQWSNLEPPFQILNFGSGETVSNAKRCFYVFYVASCLVFIIMFAGR